MVNERLTPSAGAAPNRRPDGAAAQGREAATPWPRRLQGGGAVRSGQSVWA